MITDHDEYIERLFTHIYSITDAFCNGAEKCKTNAEAIDFLTDWYNENIILEDDCVETNEDGDYDEDSLLMAERWMFSMCERVIRECEWLNKKCVRFLRAFFKEMNRLLWENEDQRLAWEADNAWLGI